MVCGISAGVALAATAFAPPLVARLLWAAGAGLVQLRLLANMLDGMVAVETNTASAVGELYNEVPDRVSDSCILIGVGHAAGSLPILGWAAALVALATAYVRAVGKGAGGASEFSGPMAKPQRMFLVTLLGLFCAVAPALWMNARPAVWTLAIVLVGSAVTVIRRLIRIAASLRRSAA